MDWNIGVSEGEGVVHAVISGDITMDHVRQMAAEGLALSVRHGVSKFLVDVRAVTPRVSTVQIYLLPKMLESLGLGRHSRVALVIAQDSDEESDYRFYRTVSQNQGFVVSLFPEPEQAWQWLLNGT
jgi:hypothetical protein